MEITKEQIQKAISKFNAGKRPFEYNPSRTTFIVEKNGCLYPLKYIYAIATGKNPRSFQTHTAEREVKKLGVEIIKLPLYDEIQFESNVEESLKNKSKRRRRLKVANKNPKRTLIQTEVFERNPDVVAEVLDRAKGICEHCNNNAPFKRKKNNMPYLEVHHKKPLAQGGEDTVKNAIALCPNCHRKMHYG